MGSPCSSEYAVGSLVPGGREGLQTLLTALIPAASRRRAQSRSPSHWCSRRPLPTCRPKVRARAPLSQRLQHPSLLPLSWVSQLPSGSYQARPRGVPRVPAPTLTLTGTPRQRAGVGVSFPQVSETHQAPLFPSSEHRGDFPEVGQHADCTGSATEVQHG